MARQRVSRQELNRRRRASGFVGRTGELSLFRDNLTRDPQDETFQYLFHVHGHAGVGKTSLLRQWEAAARNREAATAYVDDGVHSAVEAMEAVAVQLDRQGLPLKAFQELLATYRQRRHEAETAPAAPELTDPSGPAGPERRASTAGTVMAQAGLAGLGLVPGLGAVAGAMDPQQVAQQVTQGADRLRAAVGARLRSHDDVRLVVSPLRVLTPVFLQDLARAAEKRPWLVLFFDVFERTGPLLGEWLREVLVGEEHGELPLNVVAVLSGQGALDAAHWGDHRDLVCDVPLEVFTEDEARDLLAAHGITDEAVVEVVLRLTGRLPVLVDLLAQTRPGHPTDVEDPSDTAVDRFLKWITDPARRDAALACALPLQLDEDVYRAAVPDTAADQYAWLRGLPFVTGQGGRARYHDVVRTPMLRLQRTRSAARWQQQHLRLAAAYRRWREDREAALTPDTYGDDPDWREHRLGETYHLLCADPARAWPDALPDVVRACEQGTPALRRWAQLLTRAGQDAAHPPLLAWGRRLEAAAEDPVAAVTHLLTARDLTPTTRALAHAVRGRHHRAAARHDQALADCATALDLDPECVPALFGRGETLRLVRRYEEAAATLTRAIELDPTHSRAVGSLAMTHYALGRYEEALSGFTRAIALDPTYAWAFGSRALTHEALSRREDALADYGRAIELNPSYAWAYANRANTYQGMGRYEDALAAYGRAIELDGDYAWAYGSRAGTYRILGRYEDALADYGRAIELNPSYSWAYANRGSTYQEMGRYEDARVDLGRALSLDPDSPGLHHETAIVLRLLADPAEHDHWRTAADLYTARSSAEGHSGTSALGNLMVVRCATGDWPAAAHTLGRFLDRNPNSYHLREALDDLADLVEPFDLPADRLAPLRDRLNAAIAALAPPG
ncbi:tetratricopeptide repeat protein [Actinacidiphila acididurans]|uniref:Tetratricopeptide repeat protein n=1 Tax=Actinacidiphila acididurans TaxID=2784346 RepID=A0ABS2TKD5_9ACTN|nr:tetratricopeptide repeat protein [Actinacidiphila acididurans]MBM9503794.1 tetratricopeptide repeat protein [Actinacidiphila acididurans]